MTAAVTAQNWNEFKGQAVTAMLADGQTVIEGFLISLNSKGWNIKVGKKTVTRTESAVAEITAAEQAAEEIDMAEELAADDDSDMYNDDEEPETLTDPNAEQVNVGDDWSNVTVAEQIERQFPQGSDDEEDDDEE